MTINATTLDDLLEILTDDSTEIDSDEMVALPTFGGGEPDNTLGVWSWDETRLLVGSCSDDYEIVDRSEWAAK